MTLSQQIAAMLSNTEHAIILPEEHLEYECGPWPMESEGTDAR